MTFAAWVTVIGALLTVLVLASCLIWVAIALRGVSGRLSAINAGVGIINQKAAPAGPVVVEINQALAGVDARLHEVLTAQRKPKPASAPAPEVNSDPKFPAPWVVVPRAHPTGIRPPRP